MKAAHRAKSKKVAWTLAAVFVAFVLYILAAFFGTKWPVWSVSRVTKITDITFPSSTKVIKGFDETCLASEIMTVKLQMPYSALSEFQAQPSMGGFTKFESLPPDNYAFVISGLRKRGFNVTGLKNLQVAKFANASATYVFVDSSSPKTATVYVYYDEP